MYAIIDCTYGYDMIDIVRDATNIPVIFTVLEDAEIYAEEQQIAIPLIVELPI